MESPTSMKTYTRFETMKSLTMSILPKLIYKFNTIPVKIYDCFCKTDKIYTEMKGTKYSQNNLKKLED